MDSDGHKCDCDFCCVGDGDCTLGRAKRRAVLYRDALRSAIEIIDAICGYECCTYEKEDEIKRLRLIAENRKKCPNLYVEDNWEMCKKYDCFCAPDKFKSCDDLQVLFPEDEPVRAGVDLGKGSETVMVTVKDGKIVGSTVCNGGDCERKSLGAEPCPGCQHCDEKGDL